MRDGEGTHLHSGLTVSVQPPSDLFLCTQVRRRGEGEISAYKGRVQELARASHFWAESPVPRGMQTGCIQAREGRATQDP